MGRESDLQSKCLKWCKENGIYALNIHAGGMTGKGSADLILCVGGKFVAAELKVGSGRMSGAQKIRRKQIVKSGGEHITPFSLTEFVAEIERIRNA